MKDSISVPFYSHYVSFLKISLSVSLNFSTASSCSSIRPSSYEEELLAVRGRVHEMLKKSRQIFNIRFKLAKPLPVVARLF